MQTLSTLFSPNPLQMYSESDLHFFIVVVDWMVDLKYNYVHNGLQGVLERFTQIQPKLIFSVNAVHYNGRVHPHMDKVAQVVKGV